MIKDIILKKDNLNIYLENEINDSLMEILRKRLSCIIRNFKILNITFFLKNIDETDLNKFNNISYQYPDINISFIASSLANN